MFLPSTRSHFKSVFSPFFSSGIFILLNPPLGNSFLLEKASFPLLSRGVNPGGGGSRPPDFGQGPEGVRGSRGRVMKKCFGPPTPRRAATAPPPTEIDRRAAADTMTSAHSS